MCRKLIIMTSLFLFCQSCQLYHVFKKNSHTKKVSKAFSKEELDQILEDGFSFLGVPYRIGGGDKNGVDCSGLLFSIYNSSHFQIPRITSQQLEFGFPVSMNQVERGDWVFFSTQSGLINHVGIVSRMNKDSILFLHASTSKGVREDELLRGYWHNAFIKAIRPFKQIKF